MKNLIPYLDKKINEYIIFNGNSSPDAICLYSINVLISIKSKQLSILDSLITTYLEHNLKIHYGIESMVYPTDLGLSMLRGELHD